MSDETTETTTTYVYAPGLDIRSQRLLRSGLGHVVMGLLGMVILLMPGNIGIVSAFLFWTLPVGIGSLVAGLTGQRIGFKNFNGYYVSPMVWGATAVLIYSVVSALIGFLAGYAIGAISIYLDGTAVVGAVVSLIMVIAGFARSGRRTITYQL